MLFSDNIGECLSIDETALTNGELYTIVTNKSAKGKKGAIVAMIAGTNSNNVISILEKIPVSVRYQVKEVTLDMASSMNKIVKRAFPKATRVIDRFHVQKLVIEAVQEIRINHRLDAIKAETKAIKEARYKEEKYKPIVFDNDDTIK